MKQMFTTLGTIKMQLQDPSIDYDIENNTINV